MLRPASVLGNAPGIQAHIVRIAFVAAAFRRAAFPFPSSQLYDGRPPVKPTELKYAEPFREKEMEERMPNPFVHVELHTTDIDQAKKFYSQLFAWQLDDVPMPGGTYTVIKPGKGTGGGMMQQRVPGSPSSWLAYVEVDDIAAATEKAKSLGAKITMDVMELPGIGWMSMLIDPTGAALALWKPAAA
jgi:uncharacterized protein